MKLSTSFLKRLVKTISAGILDCEWGERCMMLIMKRRAMHKLITSITLICYLAVASLAAAHAFPMMKSTNSTDSGVQIIDETLSMNCHETASSIKKASPSLCKMFCAAMGNVIPNAPELSFAKLDVSSKITFLSRGLVTREPEVEPQPPK